MILIVSCTNNHSSSNINFILSAGMGIYSAPSKFQRDCMYTYKSRNVDFKYHGSFPCISHIWRVIGNVWQNEMVRGVRTNDTDSWSDISSLCTMFLKVVAMVQRWHCYSGDGYVYHKVLLKIIVQNPVLLPVDNDILYMDDCIQSFIVTAITGRKAVAALCHYGDKFTSSQLHRFPNKNHFIIKCA